MDPGRESRGKSPSEVTWLSWYMCAVSLALAAAGLLLLVLSREARPGVPVFEQWAEDAVIAVGFSTLGAVVAPRFPPKNPIGWLFCVLGLVRAMLLFSGAYAVYSLLARPGSLPGGGEFAWVVSWLWVVHSGLFAFLGLLLAGIFEVMVVTLQHALLVLTGVEDSRLAYFATAMVMAALFEPLKRRIDAFVERRFLPRAKGDDL